METKISEVTIIPVKPNKGLVALASCVIDDKLYLGSMGIYTFKPPRIGYRVTYPTKTVGRGTDGKVLSINIFHPINRAVQSAIEKGIVDEYEKLMIRSVGEDTGEKVEN